MATISIADNDARKQHSIGSGGNTANSTTFTIDFPFFALDDINVIITNSSGVDTTLTRGSGANTFAVSGTAVDDGFSGGNVTLGSVYTSSTVTIFRDIPVTRTTDFATSGPFNIASLNTELDRIIAIEQELESSLARTLSLPKSDSLTEMILPNSSSRASKFLAFDANGNAIASSQGAWQGNWSAGRVYAKGDIVKDTSTGSIYIASSSHTSSGSEPLTSNDDAAKWDQMIDAALATNAATSASDAQKLAINAEDSQYTLSDSTTGYSALHHAAKAEDYKNITLTQVNNALNYATDSANARAGSIAARDAVFAGLDSFDDRYLGSMADSQTQSVVNTTATWVTTVAQETQITVNDATGISVGMVITSATGFLAGTNVISIDGTTIRLNNVNQTAATNQAVTFTGYGVLGNFDVGLDGPSTDNDNNALAGGQLYFNSTDAEIRLYNNTSWVSAYVSGGNFVSKSGDTITGTLKFADNVKATFGDTTTPDLEIFHDTADSIINDTGAGNLKLQSGGTTKLEVTGTGATVTGTLVSDGLTLGDSEYLNIGNSSDLKLYHDSINSYISEEGSGNLTVRGSTVGLGHWTGSAFYKSIEFTGVGSNAIRFYGTDVFDQEICTISRGGITFENGENNVYNVNIKESVASVSSSSNTTNLSVYLYSYFHTTLSQNTTFIFSSPPSGANSIVVEIKQDAAGSGYTVGWPASVRWAGGSAPTLSSGANDIDILTFITRDSGTNWYGFAAGLDMS